MKSEPHLKSTSVLGHPQRKGPSDLSEEVSTKDLINETTPCTSHLWPRINTACEFQTCLFLLGIPSSDKQHQAYKTGQLLVLKCLIQEKSFTFNKYTPRCWQEGEKIIL